MEKINKESIQQEEEQAKIQEIHRLKAALRGVEEKASAKRQEDQKASKEREERRRIEAQAQLEVQQREERRAKMEVEAEINLRQQEIEEKIKQVKEQEKKRIELECLTEKAEQELKDYAARRKAMALVAQAESERARLDKANQEVRTRSIQEEKDRLEECLEKERQDQIKRLLVEQEVNDAAEAKRLSKVKAQQLENARLQAAFLEEQHRNLLEDSLKILKNRLEVADAAAMETPAEYPETQAEGEKAEEGTDGSSHDENMSPHLRHILRQVNRNY
jgi:hypothetical protein